MTIHKRVSCGGVCDHVVETERARGRVATTTCSSYSGVSSFTALDEERVDLFDGDLVGEDAFVGDRSGGGNCLGWLRVETIFGRDCRIQLLVELGSWWLYHGQQDADKVKKRGTYSGTGRRICFDLPAI